MHHVESMQDAILSWDQDCAREKSEGENRQKASEGPAWPSCSFAGGWGAYRDCLHKRNLCNWSKARWCASLLKFGTCFMRMIADAHSQNLMVLVTAMATKGNKDPTWNQWKYWIGYLAVSGLTCVIYQSGCQVLSITDWCFGTWILFSIIYGMSSFPFFRTPSFFKMVLNTTNQIVIRFI